MTALLNHYLGTYRSIGRIHAISESHASPDHRMAARLALAIRLRRAGAY